VFAFTIALCASLWAQPVVSQTDPDAILKRYCAGCHNETLKNGGLSLTEVRSAALPTQANAWERVLRKVRTGEMPPLGLPRPDAATTASFLEFIEKRLDQAAAAKPDPGSPVLHRLNRAEYGNAVRDLLALDLDHSSSLPPDDSGYGFDNIGDVLTVSPLHMEKYMATARRVSRLALGTLKPSAAVERYNAGRAVDSLDDLPLNERGGIVVKRYFPLDAEYSILVRVRGNPSSTMPAPKLDLRLNGKRAKLFDVEINPAEEAQYTRNYEMRVPFTAGTHVIAAGFLNEYAKPESGAAGGFRPGGFPGQGPIPASVEYIAIGGPFTPTGPGDTPSRRQILVCRPKLGEADEPCARRILSSLARRAYRRPATAADVTPLMKLFAAGRQDGGTSDHGIEMGLRAILVSPHFLFRVERNPRGAVPGAVHRLTDLELASRLSFFLWSSIPDEELLRLAESGKLRASLPAQVKRMLADPKAKAMVENFAGQWLHLRNVNSWQPDPDKYRDFDAPLKESLHRETELFFDAIVREDRSVLEFLHADYTFLNERLARHYGIRDIRGSYFRRVALSSPERGGILTHGSVLTVTSYPTRTSPVLRGKWILENVMGAPPPPPPPDVPDLEDSASGSAKNLRQALEKHRANAACASCHARLDPLGFALENYDAIGKFRAKEGDNPIDASGSLPGGVVVNGPGDLKKVLLDRRDEFVECLAEKLLTYAVGRGLEHYDRPVVRAIRRQTAASEYKFSALVAAIVQSTPFQMRRTPER
jgi:hypothetical protein